MAFSRYRTYFTFSLRRSVVVVSIAFECCDCSVCNNFVQRDKEKTKSVYYFIYSRKVEVFILIRRIAERKVDLCSSHSHAHGKLLDGASKGMVDL
jgi:hypothetical protein